MRNLMIFLHLHIKVVRSDIILEIEEPHQLHPSIPTEERRKELAEEEEQFGFFNRNG